MTREIKGELFIGFMIVAIAAGACGFIAGTHRHAGDRGLIACYSDGTVDMRNIDIYGPGFEKLPKFAVFGRLYRVLCTEIDA